MAGFAPEVIALLRKLGAGGITIGPGKIFWVNTAANGGDNDNVGTEPDEPFLTITYALTQCEAERNDYIFVIDDYQEPATVVVAPTRVHIIGLANYLRPNTNNPLVLLNSSGDFPIFTVSSNSNNSEIAGFGLGGGATAAGIENVAGTPMNLHIHDCIFGHSFSGNTPQDGILIGSNATNIRIEHCIFLGADDEAKVAGLLTRDGIRFTAAGDPLNGVISNNRFMGLPGIGINLQAPAGGGGWIVEDNRHFMPIVDAAAVGWGITLQSNVVGCMVNNNHAMQTGDGTGLNPFRDLSTGAIGVKANGWGMNYDGQAVTVPAAA